MNPDLLNTLSISYSTEQWQKIVNAMTFFIRAQTEVLQSNNASEEEWQELHDYEIILNDILLFVLPDKF